MMKPLEKRSSKTRLERFARNTGWITKNLIEETIQTWQPYYTEPMTADDAIEILLSFGRLLDNL